MLKNVIIPEGVNVAEWAMVDENDYKAREWIWHQLIGEDQVGKYCGVLCPSSECR